MRSQIKKTVMRVMRDDPTARERENCNYLICAVCKEMGYPLLPQQLEFIHQLPNFNSITRARAKIQEEGRFLPSTEVQRERRKHK